MPMFASPATLAYANYNTGVKGVISDAYSYESARRREMKRQQDFSVTRSRHQRDLSIDSLISSDSDGLMAQWRKGRIAELKAIASTTRRKTPSKRNYGRVEAVDAVGYLDAIERVSKDTIVVVAVYSDASIESDFVLDCLGTIARLYPTTRFVKLHYAEAEMDDEVAPAILAYKGGELFHSIMRVVDEIPSGRHLSIESLEQILVKQRILLKEEKV